MARRPRGTFVKVYPDIDDDERTASIVKVLVGELGVPQAFAPDLVVGQWRRLAHWLVEVRGCGQIGRISARAFAHVVRWDDLATADALLRAWSRSGFIDKPDSETASFADFRDCFAELIRKRASRGQKPRNSGRTRPSDRTDTSGTPDGHVRLTRGRSESESESVPTEHVVSPNGQPTSPPCPTQALIAHWIAKEKESGVQPHGSYAIHGRTFKTLWSACGNDPIIAGKAVAAFFADESPFTVAQGHSIREFSRTIEKWVKASRDTQPTKSRYEADQEWNDKQEARLKAELAAERNGHLPPEVNGAVAKLAARANRLTGRKERKDYGA